MTTTHPVPRGIDLRAYTRSFAHTAACSCSWYHRGPAPRGASCAWAWRRRSRLTATNAARSQPQVVAVGVMPWVSVAWRASELTGQPIGATARWWRPSSGGWLRAGRLLPASSHLKRRARRARGSRRASAVDVASRSFAPRRARWEL